MGERPECDSCVCVHVRVRVRVCVCACVRASTVDQLLNPSLTIITIDSNTNTVSSRTLLCALHWLPQVVPN